MSEIKTEYTRNIVCPFCGYEDRDSWEVGKGQEGETETDCRDCGKTFLVVRHVSVDYSSRKKPTLPNDGENKSSAEEVNS